MENKNFKDQCSDMTKEFNIQIPCMLAERVEAFSSENNIDITLIVIEALDTFLREQKTKENTFTNPNI